jgi:hypothetical protein
MLCFAAANIPLFSPTCKVRQADRFVHKAPVARHTWFLRDQMSLCIPAGCFSPTHDGTTLPTPR